MKIKYVFYLRLRKMYDICIPSCDKTKPRWINNKILHVNKIVLDLLEGNSFSFSAATFADPPPLSYSRSSSDVKHFMKDSFQQLIGSNSPFMVYCTWQVKSDLLHLPSSQCVSFLLHHLLSSSPSIFHIYFFSPPPRYSFPPTDCRVCFGSRMQSSKLHAKGERYYDHRTLDDT